MKKYIGLSFLMFLVGFLVCHYWAVVQEQGEIMTWAEDKERLQIRTEEYEPSCAELKRRTAPTLIRKGSDYFTVLVREDDFVVFGLNVEGDNLPISAWWSAGRENALVQACGK